MSRSKLVGRVIAGVVAVVLVGGWAPQVARADGGELRVTLPQVPTTATLIAVSGSSVLANINDAYQVSTDKGLTWSPARLPLLPCAGDDCDITFGDVSGGVLPIRVNQTLAWYSLTANAELSGSVRHTWDDSTTLDGDGNFRMATGGFAVFWSPTARRFQVVSSSGTTRSLGADVTEVQSVLADGSVITKDGGDSDAAASVTAIRPDGTSVPVDSVADGDFWGFVEGATTLGYVKGEGSDWRASKLCVWSAASSNNCVDAPDEESQFELLTDTGALISDDGTDYAWLARDDSSLAAPVDLQVPDSVSWGFPLSQDTGRVVLTVADLQVSSLEQVLADGSLSRWSTTPASEPEAVNGLALTPTSVVGGVATGNWNGGMRAWSRSVGSTVGDEQSVLTTSVRASVMASAGRWAVPVADGVRLYDNDGQTSQTIGGVDEVQPYALSGPHLLANGYRVDADGHRHWSNLIWSADAGWQDDELARGIFGSLVLDVDRSADDHDTVVVRDLTGVRSPVPLTYSTPETDGGSRGSYGDYQLWGDWIATTYSQSDTDSVEVRNWRTGQVLGSQPGDLWVLGDGAAVVRVEDATFTDHWQVWNFLTGSVAPLTGSFSWASQFSLDGAKLAYTTRTELVVKTISDMGRSAPRSLGVVAPASFTPESQTWSADVDLTKPAAAGQLDIASASGAVVRSIAVPATANGSLRGITWDGRDNSGVPVPGGTYSFRLTGAVAVDGTDTALGTVEVKVVPVTPGVPVISGAAATGSALTANPGSWGPSGVALAYQWLRDGQPISGATSASYAVAAADTGHALSVRVTGMRGTASAVAVSAPVTASQGAFSQAPVPTISGTWFYGKTVAATPGNWAPAPDSLACQWLRDGVPIPGATAISYRLGAADVGHAVSVRFTATKAGYGSVATYSSAGAVGGTKFTKVASPSVSGKAKVGKSLKAKVGKSSPKPSSVAYQWLRNGQPIVGAGKATYKLAKADKKTKVSVRVTVLKDGYYPVTKTSKAKKVG